MSRAYAWMTVTKVPGVQGHIVIQSWQQVHDVTFSKF